MYRIIACIVLSALAAVAQEDEKEFKSGEFDSYNWVVKDINAGAFAKAVTDLEAWKAKYANSDYVDDRDALFVQAYAGSNQPSRTLEVAKRLMNKGLNAAFPGDAGRATVLRILYSASWAITQIPSPSRSESEVGQKAAQELLASEAPLPGVPADKWTQARETMRQEAAAALVHLAMVPGLQAMQKQPPDCAGAEAAYSKVLTVYTDRSVLSWELGRALICEAKQSPAREAEALYEFQRAAVLDPTLGGARTDPKQVQAYADNAYSKYHGSDEGLEQLRALVRTSPFPPAGFTIQSADEIKAKNQEEFEASHPELALWTKIRSVLTQPDGEQFFESDLKGAAMPRLKGVLVKATPACRPRELLVSVPLPDAATSEVPEIRLKLDKPLAGKPAPGAEFAWEGVPSGFTAQPLVLTMDVDASKVDGLGVAECAVSPRPRSGAR